MAMDKQMGVLTGRDIGGQRASKLQDRLDVCSGREHKTWSRLNLIMEFQGCPLMGIVSREGLWLGPIRVENGEYMRHTTRAVMAKLFNTAYRKE